jgi:hypothetical protein
MASRTRVCLRKDEGIDGADGEAVAASGAPVGGDHGQWWRAEARREADGELGAGVAT